ncbi:MAG: hypothetical protein A3E87_06175 [Gammaproteobacteria bacterium RIFCSPHIGHO2_12_FULL_35_23]|nr:MAG: hypothetical protein A3E87_06175 [Gammaproteobacteria bacterium RIFCSPHIGHO2_12_FULL_35_23]
MKKQWLIISASSREASESLRVAQHVLSQAKVENNIEAELLDLSQYKLPEINNELLADPSKNVVWKNISEKLSQATGFVFVVPEWHGMAPPKLMKLLLLCTNFEVAHKPALIVSISAGLGGTYPVIQLRTVGFKNNHICFIPENLIVRRVGDLFHESSGSHENDIAVRKRLNFCLSILSSYDDGLSLVRKSPVDIKAYPYGQ